MEKFGKYILAKLIATGGMAEVFLAKEVGISGFQRILAIKRVLPHLAKDREFIEMFTGEARLSAQLTHPNIVQIYDFGLVDNSYYLTMEFIDGMSLNDVLNAMAEQNTTLPLELAVLIMTDLCQGLGYAHNKRSLNNEPLNIVHRDISPKNAMISYEGAVKLMDFGIAKAADQQRKETVTGVIKGKISYLSPEQVMGEKLDRRSDIFAMGIVFFEMLTSQRCFTGDNEFAILFKIRSAQVKPPSSINPQVPPELDAIVAKMLHPEKEQRYQTAEEVIEDLNKFRYKFGYLATANTLAAFLRGLRGEEDSGIAASLQQMDWQKLEQEIHEENTSAAAKAAEPSLKQLPPEEGTGTRLRKTRAATAGKDNTLIRQGDPREGGTRKQKTRPNKFKDETRVDFSVPAATKSSILGPLAIVVSTVLLLGVGVVFALVILPRLTAKDPPPALPTPTPIAAPATPIPDKTSATPVPPGPTAAVAIPSPAIPEPSSTPTIPAPTPTHTPIPPSPTPKRPTTGTVTLTSSIPVEVFEGGQRVGKLSGSGLKLQLSPGSHSFTAMGYTGSTYYRTQLTVQVEAGKSTSQAVSFPDLASLNIISALPAVVYLNGAKIDDTPIQKLNVTAGSYEVRFEFKNGASSSEHVTVKPGQFKKVFGKP